MHDPVVRVALTFAETLKIHVDHHGDTRGDNEILRKLDQLLSLHQQGNYRIMAKIDDLTTQVAANTDVTQSARILIQGFSARLDEAIAAAKAGNDAQLETLATELRTSDDELAAAVAANTTNPPTP